MGIFNKKKKESKIDVNVVGVVGRKVAYIIFTKNGDPIQGTLARLNHPGNVKAREMQSSGARVLRGDGEDAEISINPAPRINAFFSQCVFPVTIGATELEKDLIEDYGASDGRPSPDDMHPKIFAAWEQVMALFFGGDLWDLDDESESGEAV